MGENAGDAEYLDEEPLFFVAYCDGFEERYGPYTDLNEFFWNAGFVTGWLGGKGHPAGTITIATYRGDQLVDLRGAGAGL